MNQKSIALAWLNAGWEVFPCYEKETWAGSKLHTRKSPDTPRGFYDATNNPEIVEAYWDEHPERLVGIRIPVSVNVLDIDLKIDPPKDGFEALAEAGLEYPDTFSVETPSGGLHAYFKKDPSRLVKATTDLKLSDGRVLVGVDRRTLGSYTIAYSAEAPRIEELAEAPNWLNEESEQTGLNPYSAGLNNWFAELPLGEPDGRVSLAIKRFPTEDFGHADMLRMQTELVKLGAERHTGVQEAIELLQARWLHGEYNTIHYQADWNSALEGAVRKFGGAASSKMEIALPLSTSDSTTPIKPLADAHDSAAMEWVASFLSSRYCWNKRMGWLGYRDGVWESRSDEHLREAIRKIIPKFWEDARRDTDLHSVLSTLKGFLSKARLSALEALLRGFLEVDDSVLDGHVDLLNAKNGVVDLATAELLPHDPSYYFTKQTICSYQPDATHPDWNKALEAIPSFARTYTQCFFGQSLTGFTLSEDIALILGGGGRNGKSTLCDLTLKVVGKFGVSVSANLLAAKDSDHTTEMTDLIGKRFALLEEFPAAGSLNANRLKRIVGTTEITGRRMRQDNQTWDATHTLVITTNHEIHIPYGDEGTWRRLVKINFPYRFVAKPELPNDRQGDQGLRMRLVESTSGQHEAVLAWLVEGAMQWFANGRKLPKLPKEVADETESWRSSQDTLGSCISTHLEADPESYIAVCDLHSVYRLETNGGGALGDPTQFKSALTSHELIVSRGLQVRRERHATKSVSRPSPLSLPAISQSSLRDQESLIRGLRFKK
jgi:P4 family phage/plasmid primase-like protien